MITVFSADLRRASCCRERVRLALQHQTTDRIPIARVCAGINPPADREDVLQALQFSARGMDPRAERPIRQPVVIRRRRQRANHPPPFGSVEDVRRETSELITVLGKNGGYLLGSSHWIQSGTPAEKIYAMFETALNYYPF
jgi:hypothetical protein